MSTFSRLRSVARVGQKNRSDDYPEMVGTVTLIRGKAFGGLEEVAFDAFGAEAAQSWAVSISSQSARAKMSEGASKMA